MTDGNSELKGERSLSKRPYFLPERLYVDMVRGGKVVRITSRDPECPFYGSYLMHKQYMEDTTAGRRVEGYLSYSPDTGSFARKVSDEDMVFKCYKCHKPTTDSGDMLGYYDNGKEDIVCRVCMVAEGREELDKAEREGRFGDAAVIKGILRKYDGESSVDV